MLFYFFTLCRTPLLHQLKMLTLRYTWHPSLLLHQH